MDEEEDTLLAHRWVKLDCDYSTDGFWDIEGSACPLEALPISEDLRVMIRGWQMWSDQSKPLVPGFDLEGEAHLALGRFITRLVKEELPD